MRPSTAFGAAVLALVLGVGCDTPTRERIDSWRATAGGATKLAAALASTEVDPALRARAAVHLVALGDADAVLRTLQAKPSPKVLDALIPLLGADSQVGSELQVPTPGQVAAKDALFDLRPLASPAQRDRIDDQLVSWFGGYYEGRAGLGRHRGDEVLAAIGSRAALALDEALKQILAQPPPSKETFVPVGDELLRGLAAAGPAGVAIILDLAQRKLARAHPDETLPARAMLALETIYVERRRDPAPLAQHLERLAAIAGDARAPATIGNVAFDLIARTGKPECLPPLTSLAQNADDVRVWMALQKGLECGGADAIVPMAEALQPERDYDLETMDKFFWTEIVRLGPAALAPARTLLSSGSWIARLTGAKVLARIGDANDAARVRDLERDAAALRPSRKLEKKR